MESLFFMGSFVSNLEDLLIPPTIYLIGIVAIVILSFVLYYMVLKRITIENKIRNNEYKAPFVPDEYLYALTVFPWIALFIILPFLIGIIEGRYALYEHHLWVIEKIQNENNWIRDRYSVPVGALIFTKD